MESKSKKKKKNERKWEVSEQMLWTSDSQTIVNSAIKKCKLGEKQGKNKRGRMNTSSVKWSKQLLLGGSAVDQDQSA